MIQFGLPLRSQCINSFWVIELHLCHAEVIARVERLSSQCGDNVLAFLSQILLLFTISFVVGILCGFDNIFIFIIRKRIYILELKKLDFI